MRQFPFLWARDRNFEYQQGLRQPAGSRRPTPPSGDADPAVRPGLHNLFGGRFHYGYMRGASGDLKAAFFSGEGVKTAGN